MTYRELQLAQESLVQSDKLASLVGLVSGVAHEINTPIGVVVTGASALDAATRQIHKTLVDGSVRKSDMASYLQTVDESCASSSATLSGQRS